MPTRPTKLRCPLLAATAAVLTVTSLAGAGLGPSDAVTALHLGSTANSSAGSTQLFTSGTFGLHATPNGENGRALVGSAAATSGQNIGVGGVLEASEPDFGSAGVVGESHSTTADGPGVHGFHFQATGSAPGVLGETGSGTNFAAGVHGTAGSSPRTATSATS